MVINDFLGELKMNYKKIEISGNNDDYKLDLLLTKIARWHNLTPKLWRADYKVSEKDVEETVNRIKNSQKKDLFLAIAEDEQDNVQGFIWACRKEEAQDSVLILSLYTAEEYRDQGIATNLKKMLEEWSRLEGIKVIETTVHYTNKRMIDINQKLGYIPGMVHMKKKL